MTPLQTLRHHVTGAIERGEKTAIVEQRTVIHQSMSAQAVTTRIKREAQNFGLMIRDGHWTLAHAQDVLARPDENKLDLFKIAGLAMAIACFQCSEG